MFGNLSSSFVDIENQSAESTSFQHLLRRYTLYFVYLGKLQIDPMDANVDNFKASDSR